MHTTIYIYLFIAWYLIARRLFYLCILPTLKSGCQLRFSVHVRVVDALGSVDRPCRTRLIAVSCYGHAFTRLVDKLFWVGFP